MVLRIFATLIKIIVASLIVGVLLSFLEITPQQVLTELGLTPEAILSYIQRGINWAIPHLILGSIVIVPVWLIIYLFRPPRGSDRP